LLCRDEPPVGPTPKTKISAHHGISTFFFPNAVDCFGDKNISFAALFNIDVANSLQCKEAEICFGLWAEWPDEFVRKSPKM
jgi:hypothetical protein